MPELPEWKAVLCKEARRARSECARASRSDTRAPFVPPANPPWSAVEARVSIWLLPSPCRVWILIGANIGDKAIPTAEFGSEEIAILAESLAQCADLNLQVACVDKNARPNKC